MKIVHINSMYSGSTGRIMRELARLSNEKHEVYISYPLFDDRKRGKEKNTIIIGNRLDGIVHHILGRLTGFCGCYSIRTTKIFINKLEEISPDIIHLHNLHNCYINLSMLFNYIKKNNIAVVWTLHDCWAFTGQCAYYSDIKCEKWKEKCGECKQINKYPKTYVDVTEKMYKLKKKFFTKVDLLTLLTPSLWLEEQVKESFLKEYTVITIHNGIDLQVFHPVNSQFKEQHGIENKIMILGISFCWDRRKGFDTFCELSKCIDKRKYQIVMVGVKEKQKKYLDKDVICLNKTNNLEELANIYSAADVFFNPTREEVFGLVNVEALGCGTPVITYDVGGCKEIIDESCGRVLKNRDIKKTILAIEEIIVRDMTDACIKRASKFEKNKQYQKYIELYKEIERKKYDCIRTAK